MFDWIPAAAREMRAELVELYWILLVTVTLLVVVFEFFKTGEGQLNPGGIIKRVALSIIMLWSFDETVNTIGALTDGVADRLGGTDNLKALFAEIKRSHGENSPGLFRYRQMIMYYLSAICHMIALVGYFVTDVSIHFVYTILYVLSPLMILAYVPRATSHITANLYRGILQVSLWKILWCLMGNLLFRLADVSDVGDTESMIMRPILNIIIAVSMFRIPFFASSLLGDGLLGTAKSVSQHITLPVSRGIKRTSLKGVGKGGREIFSGFRGTRKFTGRLAKRTGLFGKKKHDGDKKKTGIVSQKGRLQAKGRNTKPPQSGQPKQRKKKKHQKRRIRNGKK